RTLLVRDPGAHDDVLFSRMWQFPAIEATRHPKTELARHLKDDFRFDAPDLLELPHAKHCVTFRNITLVPFIARLKKLPKLPRSRQLPLAQLARVPISSATRKIAEAALHAVEHGVQTRLF
ncbi:MAG: hypothetical protein WCA98_13490, partial [Candidatus Acidiferrales bacterium]